METPIDPKFAYGIRNQREEFLDLVEGARGDLYRYCRSLAGNPWDAEDLVQEALLRAFGALSFRASARPVRDARGYLFRIATNAFVDRWRRARREEELAAPADVAAPETPPPSPEVRDALALLAHRLAPRERAAFLLVDVFDFALAEAAAALGMTTGAVKAALHRGRGKLAALRETPERAPAARRDARGDAVLDEFARAFNARDLDAIMAVFAPDATGEIVGCLTEDDRDQIRDGSMIHTIRDARSGEPYPAGDPGAEVVEIDGERMVVLFYVREDGRRGIGDVLRFEKDDDGRIRRLRWWYFSPELLAEIAGRLGEPARPNGHRYR